MTKYAEITSTPKKRIYSVSPLGKKIHKLLLECGNTNYSEFERNYNVKTGTLRRLIAGYIKSTDTQNLANIAKGFSMSVTELLDMDQIEETRVRFAKYMKQPEWVEITTDEMASTLEVGDFALVERAINSFVGTGVYWVDNGKEQSFRRICSNPVDNKLMVKVDNKVYGMENLVEPSQLNIIGKLVGKYTTQVS